MYAQGMPFAYENSRGNPNAWIKNKSTMYAQGMPFAYEDYRKPIFACEEPIATH